MKVGVVLVMASLLGLSTNAYGQGHDAHQKPEKVSSAMMQEKATDTTQHDVAPEGGAQTIPDTVAERDVDTIRAAVQRSTTFIVIKALALAVAIVGVGVVYLPRRSMGAS